jgi:hypothetical protein
MEAFIFLSIVAVVFDCSLELSASLRISSATTAKPLRTTAETSAL